MGKRLFNVGLIFWSASLLGAKQKGGDPHPIVEMKTSMGTIHLKLDAKKAPKTVKNFLRYVDKKFYDGTVFHRVISAFMIQGGGFKLSGKTLEQKRVSKPIETEASNGLKNLKGTIAMARTNDPNSATSQFFINVVDNERLNYTSKKSPGYTVFGSVTQGLDVVKKVKAVKTGKRSVSVRDGAGKLASADFQDVPVTNVVIKAVRRVKTRQIAAVP